MSRTLVPSAKSGLYRFKLEVANQLGMRDYDQIDKGNLTSRQNGTVGGNMVRKMIEDYENKLR